MKQIKFQIILILLMLASAAAQVRFYQHTSYGGSHIAYTSSVPDLTRIRFGRGNWNDQISSIVVPDGYSVTVYEHTNYGGRSRTFTSNIANLVVVTGGPNRGNWNDVISSFRISKTGDNQQPVSASSDNWGSISLPGDMIGSWRNNSNGVTFTISTESVFNGSNHYYIRRIHFNKGTYRIVTEFNNRYYTWFFQPFYNNLNMYVNNSAFNSVDAAYRTSIGTMTKLIRVSDASALGSASQPLQGSPPIQGSPPVQNSEQWYRVGFPSQLNGVWYQNSQWTYSINQGTQIQVGNSFYQVRDVFLNNGVHKVLTEKDNSYYTFHFRVMTDVAMQASLSGPYYNYNDAYNAASGYMPNHYKKTESERKEPLQSASNWKDASFPATLNGNWYNSRNVWNYFIENSRTIRTGNKFYNVTNTYYYNGVYKILATLNGQYYTFHFRIDNNRQMRVHRTGALANFNAAKNAGYGNLDVHTKR
ncbi:MAG: peptidase inhibitor family I36 protein [Calditrichaeota bacterium]|nr:peptidase inhibitor family I36 protein [Calditrichota bacterium]